MVQYDTTKKYNDHGGLCDWDLWGWRADWGSLLPPIWASGQMTSPIYRSTKMKFNTEWLCWFIYIASSSLQFLLLLLPHHDEDTGKIYLMYDKQLKAQGDVLAMVPRICPLSSGGMIWMKLKYQVIAWWWSEKEWKDFTDTMRTHTYLPYSYYPVAINLKASAIMLLKVAQLLLHHK